MNYGDLYIEPLEHFPCQTKEELNKREGELIRIHKNNCVNRRIECRTSREYCEDNKETNYQRTKEKIL